MTVKELIAELKKLPQQQEVWVYTSNEYGTPIGGAVEAFITDRSDRPEGESATVFPDLFDYDEVEDDDKEKIVLIS